MNNSSFRYYLMRRKVVARTLKNWVSFLLREPRREKGRAGQDAVVFVRLNARTRIHNLGWTLRRKQNIRTILITRVFEYDFQRTAFDEIKIFLSYGHLAGIVSRLAARYNIVAVVGSLQPAAQTAALLGMKRTWPVLIDHYDSIWCLSYFSGHLVDRSETFITISKEEVLAEKYCFENADGIIARSGTLVQLIKAHRIPTPIRLIEDKCNQKFFQPVPPLKGPKGPEWSVVYPGIFYPMHFDSRFAGDAQLVPLGPLFAREKIHFHLYPSPHHDYPYPEYEAEASRNPYFHMHPAVDFDKVHREISQYDFGWNANDFSKSVLFSETSRQYELSIKFYTFLEAGLPVIINGLLERSNRIIARTGAGFALGMDAPAGLRRLIESQDIARMRQNVIRARQQLEIDTVSDELIAFLREPELYSTG